MHKLKCRDLGMDCDHVVTGESVQEVSDKAMQHAREVHMDVLRTMSSPEQMAAMQELLLSKIQ